jgi:hypothetical protein
MPEPTGEFLSLSKDLSKFVAAGPVSRIRQAALQTDNLLRISRREVSMMSTSSAMAGFASHRRRNGRSVTVRRFFRLTC